MKRAALLLSALAWCACAPLTHYGLQVRVTENPDVVRGCKFLGNVPGHGDNALRNKVGEMGGNVFNPSTHEAFRCEQPKP